MMKKLLLFFLLISLQTKAQTSSTDPRLIGLDSAFARVLDNWKCAGFAVAVVEKDKIIYAKGFGYADYENKIPVTEHTQFASGSCTKAFTCATLGILRSENKIDFNNPVRDYLPQLKFYNDEMNKNITVRDLMCHRTGLPRHDNAWGLFASNSADTLLKRVQFQEPNYGLREKWQYNNFMFVAQGKIAENLTGKPYRAYLREKIFRPLGMTNINFSVDTMALNKDKSFGYTVTDDDKISKVDYFNLDVMSAVGGINTSVSEMAKWAMLWVNNGVYKGQRILPEAYVREAMSSQMIVREAFPAANNPTLFFENYGLGWFLSSYRSHYRVEHGGNISGFSANVCLFPTDGLGIVVFSNQDASKVNSIVRNLVADRMLNLPYKDWNSYLFAPEQKNRLAAKEAKKQMLSQKKTDAKPAHELNEYEGFYSNGGYGKFEVSNSHDSLFALFPKTKWFLKPYGHDVFEAFIVDKNGVANTDFSVHRILFNQNTNGDIASANIAFEAELPKPIEFTRTIKPKELSKADLQNYIGEYLLSGMALKVSLKNDKTLFLTPTNQPELELVAVEKDKFNFKGVAGYSVAFNKDASELYLTQPNGTFKAIKKK